MNDFSHAMLQCCVRRRRRRLPVTLYLLWLNGASDRAKVTIDSLWEVAYRKLIGAKMNELDLCLEVA